MFAKKHFPVFIFLFVSVLFFSCKKEEALADLNFQVEKIDGVYHCSWTATNISTFEKYYIVHSPILMGQEDEPSQSFSHRWTSVYSQATNSINIAIGAEEDLTLYFQLFVDIDDRMIRSNVVVFEKEISEVIDFEANSSLLFQEKNAVYFFDEDTKDFLYYDFVEKEVKKKRRQSFLINQFIFCTGNNGFGEELYLVDDKELIILDPNTLAQKAGYIANRSITSVATNDDGLIVLAIRDNDVPTQILARDNLNVLNNLNTSNATYPSRGVIFLSKEENEFVELGESYFNYFKINSVGEILEQQEINTPFPNPQNVYFSMIASPLENYFVTITQGQLFDSSLNGLADFSLAFGDLYLSCFFEKDETALYAFLYSPFGTGISFVDKFSIPDLEFVERKEFKGFTLNWFYRNDKIHGAFYSDYFKCIFIKPID